jgi:hypothetical protein
VAIVQAPKWDGTTPFPDDMEWGYKAWNSTGSGNTACERHFGSGNGWRCFFGQNVAEFVKTPMFVLNSKYDSWQGPAIIGCSEPVEACPPARIRAGCQSSSTG